MIKNFFLRSPTDFLYDRKILNLEKNIRIFDSPEVSKVLNSAKITEKSTIKAIEEG